MSETREYECMYCGTLVRFAFPQTFDVSDGEPHSCHTTRENGAQGMMLGGFLVLPEGYEPPPDVVTIIDPDDVVSP